jgi:hypothetical protein
VKLFHFVLGITSETESGWDTSSFLLQTIREIRVYSVRILYDRTDLPTSGWRGIRMRPAVPDRGEKSHNRKFRLVTDFAKTAEFFMHLFLYTSLL